MTPEQINLLTAAEQLQPILDRAASNASGMPDHEYVSRRIRAFRDALAKARKDG